MADFFAYFISYFIVIMICAAISMIVVFFVVIIISYILKIFNLSIFDFFNTPMGKKIFKEIDEYEKWKKENNGKNFFLDFITLFVGKLMGKYEPIAKMPVWFIYKLFKNKN